MDIVNANVTVPLTTPILSNNASLAWTLLRLGFEPVAQIDMAQVRCPQIKPTPSTSGEREGERKVLHIEGLLYCKNTCVCQSDICQLVCHCRSQVHGPASACTLCLCSAYFFRIFQILAVVGVGL